MAERNRKPRGMGRGEAMRKKIIDRGRGRCYLDLPQDAGGDCANVDTKTELKTSIEDAGKGRRPVRAAKGISEFIRSRPENLITKSGNRGAGVNVLCNYFRLLKKPDWIIHQYHVGFSPDVELLRLRRAYLYEHKSILGGFLYDGASLYSTHYFVDKAQSKVLHLVTKSRDGSAIKINIKHVGIVDKCDSDQIQILNLILRRAMEGLNLQLFNRNYFDPLAKINLNAYNLEIWPGYLTSIRQHEHEILLCVDTTHKMLRTETVHHLMTKCYRDSKDFHNAFKKIVLGMVILTNYNTKTYRVDDIDFTKSPKDKFSTKNGEISFTDYYKQRYNITIRDERQPLLVSRPTEKNLRAGNAEYVLLIPELCRVTGLTDEMRSDFRLMKAVSDQTRLNPERRLDRLRVFNERLLNSDMSTKVLEQWNMKLDKKLVEIPSRVFPPEKIIFGNSKKIICDKNADWSKEFRNVSMFSHVDIKRWHVVVPQKCLRECKEFVQLCIRSANAMKMHISEPIYEQIMDDRLGSYHNAIGNVADIDSRIVMVVMTNQNSEKYASIKKKCCIDRPIVSQVVTLKTIAPRGNRNAGLMSVATKVVIQMNAKLMGAPWMVEIPLSGLMTIGFDVCHSSIDSRKSYGAFVATMDLRKSTNYYSAVSDHLKGEEISHQICLHLTCALRSYHKIHGTLPERILFYRDGVGDGQLYQVFQTEVKNLKKQLHETYESLGHGNNYRLAFIVVSKRINTRLFMTNRNPSPGTVVDDIITLPERYDFFLVSQSVRHGTVSPTSYNIIHDNMGLKPDQIQILTYKMTHLYYNWTGTCCVPAVCKYAHKLAYLVAESLHRTPSNSLENQLYFL